MNKRLLIWFCKYLGDDMKYNLFFPTPLSNVDENNDNIDVCIELPNRFRYTFVVATPQNLQKLMKTNKMPYVTPGAPMLIVEQLTEVNIRLIIEKVIEDPVMLHIYGEDLWA